MFHKYITKKLLIGLADFLSKNVKLEKLHWDETEQSYTVRKLLDIPIQIGVHDKLYAIVNSSSARKTFPPEAAKASVELGRIVPRIGITLQNLVFDLPRHLNKNNKLELSTGEYINAPVPYNLECEVSVITKDMDSNLQILETIIPMFTPSLSLDLNIFVDTESIPITLNSISSDWPNELSENDERIFTTNFYFTIRANYYLQKKTGKRIEHIEINYKNEIDGLWEKYTMDAITPLPSDYPYTPKDQIQYNTNIEDMFNPQLPQTNSSSDYQYGDGSSVQYDDGSGI